MEALGSWKVCMWGHLSARGRTANAFLCFGTVSPDSAFRLHVSAAVRAPRHLELEAVLCSISLAL
jgi:hypothetical protein